jgi:hypothetical protein
VSNPTSSFTSAQAPSGRDLFRAHGTRATSSAMLRHMRTLARAHRVDVGPACCAQHSLAWIKVVREREVVPW